MKKLVVLLVILFCSLSSFAQEVSTYYLVRHAEKDRSDKTNSNPELTEDLGHATCAEVELRFWERSF